MKKGILLSALVMLITVMAWAQPTITLLTFESYTFDDKFDTEYGTGKIRGGFQWGGGLEFGLAETVAIELIYQNLKSDVYYQGIDNRYEGNVGINYVLLGVYCIFYGFLGCNVRFTDVAVCCFFF